MNRQRIVLGLVLSLVVGTFASAGTAADGRVAVLHLDGPLLERPMGDLGFSFGPKAVTLTDMVARFKKAGEDDKVQAVLVTIGQPALGLAQLEELRQAMQACPKPVYLHVDELNTGTYALATACRHVSVTPTGMVWVLGFFSEAPYVREMLAHLRVEADFVHIGDYKSAGEMFYRDGPSEAAEANMNWLLDSLFESVVKMIADTRYNGDEAKVRSIIDGGPYTAEQALALKMIDSVKHRQDLVAELKRRYGDDLKFVHHYGREEGPELDFNNPFAMFQLIGDLMAGKEPTSQKESIAVVYVDGPIVTGEEKTDPFGGGGGMAYSTTIRKALDKAAGEDSIRAVILRVDSPGGSALASEIIYDAVQRVRAAGKPVVVSMGNVAASGGYYVSCGADHIFADPTTITASIGVVGGKIVTTEMWNWMGVKWHAYQRGASAAIMSSSRSWNDEERTKIVDWMEKVYGDFTGHIVKHRGSKLTKDIQDMAGGRVYAGAQAIQLGLVDDLGSMHDALEKAADLAYLGEYELRVLPRPKTIFDLIRQGMAGEETDSVRVNTGLSRSSLFEAAWPVIETLEPARARMLRQALVRLELLRSEQVLLMTPSDFVVRYR